MSTTMVQDGIIINRLPQLSAIAQVLARADKAEGGKTYYVLYLRTVNALAMGKNLILTNTELESVLEAVGNVMLNAFDAKDEQALAKTLGILVSTILEQRNTVEPDNATLRRVNGL